METQSLDAPPTHSYEYPAQSYEHSGRYSPEPHHRMIESRPNHGRNSRSRSRSPSRGYPHHHFASQTNSLQEKENYDQREFYPPHQDSQSLHQRESTSSQQHEQSKPSATIYVRNLHSDATEEEVADVFREHGAVESCTFLLNNHSGGPRAFVKMASTEEADKALSLLQNYEVKDRFWVVERARLDQPREKTPGMYKGRYPTRASRGGRSFRGDSYRSRDSVPRDSPRESFRESRPGGYRRPEPSYHTSPGRYDYDRPPYQPPREMRSPPPYRMRGGRYGPGPEMEPGYRGREYPGYERGYGERPAFAERGPSYYERPRPPMGRDGPPPPRYYQADPRRPSSMGEDTRYERYPAYGQGYGAGYGDRRRG